jgi:thioredoxin 1
LKPCKMVAPIFEKIAEKYKNEIIFAKLNVDENPDIASEFGIMSIPTFLVFKNGEVVGKIVGAMPEKILEEKILEFLK